MPSSVTAATILRSARTSAGITQAELADRLGSAQPSVARLERPDANPTWNTLILALRMTGHDLDLVPRQRAKLDIGQLRERLALSPAERLRVFQRSQHNLLRMLAGAQKSSG